MASQAVSDAVEQRLGTTWISTDGSQLPVVGLNSNDQVPADKSAFLAIEYPIANAQQISIGTPGGQVYREEGAFRIVINVPLGAGERQARGWADELRTLFRGKQFSGVNTWAPSSPVSVGANEAGSYWQLAIAVPYYADIIG